MCCRVATVWHMWEQAAASYCTQPDAATCIIGLTKCVGEGRKGERGHRARHDTCSPHFPSTVHSRSASASRPSPPRPFLLLLVSPSHAITGPAAGAYHRTARAARFTRFTGHGFALFIYRKEQDFSLSFTFYRPKAASAFNRACTLGHATALTMRSCTAVAAAFVATFASVAGEPAAPEVLFYDIGVWIAC